MSQQEKIRQRLEDLSDSVRDLIDDVRTGDIDNIIESIGATDPVRTVNFRCCGIDKKVPPELIYAYCPQCNSKVKLRCFGSYVDVYDVLYAARLYFDKQKTELEKENSHEE